MTQHTSKVHKDEHKAIHVRLHASLDELVADFTQHTKKSPSKATIQQLMVWSHEQTIKPTETR